MECAPRSWAQAGRGVRAWTAFWGRSGLVSIGIRQWVVRSLVQAVEKRPWLCAMGAGASGGGELPSLSPKCWPA